MWLRAVEGDAAQGQQCKGGIMIGQDLRGTARSNAAETTQDAAHQSFLDMRVIYRDAPRAV